MRSVRKNKILAKWFPIFCNHYYSPTRVCILVRVIESNTCMQQSLQDNDIFSFLPQLLCINSHIILVYITAKQCIEKINTFPS